MADSYPQSYFEARQKSSDSLLVVFDQQLKKHAHVSMPSTDTYQGAFFFIASIVLMGLPLLELYGINSKKYNIRHALYQNLVDITNDEGRIALSTTPSCIDALKEETIAFTDLAQSPIKLLRSKHSVSPVIDKLLLSRSF
jgi:hypothetical protein